MRISPSLRNVLLQLAVGLSLFFVASPALAQTTPSAPALNSGAGSTASYNWAGYVAQGSGFTSVSGSWVVGAISSTNTSTADATWVGIGGVASSDLIQVGTERLTSNSGAVTYQAFYEILPQDAVPVSLTISPGDSVSASLIQQTPGQWTISFKDNTSGENFTTTVAYNSSLSSAEWIEEMPSRGNLSLIPLNAFGTVNFTGASAIENNEFETLAQTGAQAMTMVNNARQALAQTSALGEDGESFSVSRTTLAANTGVGTSQIGRMRRIGVGVQGYSGQTGMHMVRRQFYIVRMPNADGFEFVIQAW